MPCSSITRFVASVLLVSASAVSAAPAPHAADDPDTIIFNGTTYTITQATTVALVTATAGAGLSYMHPASNGDEEQKGYMKGVAGWQALFGAGSRMLPGKAFVYGRSFVNQSYM
ncbi:hypothetical protein DL768_006355 [Monosporascus sp. mg162]|nr:hypothetical protein DL768_006355 [Monosporascus sp. mg162]